LLIDTIHAFVVERYFNFLIFGNNPDVQNHWKSDRTGVHAVLAMVPGQCIKETVASAVICLAWVPRIAEIELAITKKSKPVFLELCASSCSPVQCQMFLNGLGVVRDNFTVADDKGECIQNPIQPCIHEDKSADLPW
jgi:hypothetical protein